MSKISIKSSGNALRVTAVAAVALVALLALGLLVPSVWLRDTLTAIFASGLLGISLHLLVGYTGLVSFGHAAYFAIGGYVFGMVLQAQGFTAMTGPAAVPLAILAAMLGTALCALIVGLICARLSDIYFAFLTLAFQMLFVSIVQALVQFTGGDQGLTGGIPRPEFLGIDLTQSWDRYAFCAFVFVMGVYAIRMITDSSFGYTLRMIRDNEQRARFLGINTYAAKVVSFMIAGTVASLGGVILAILTSAAYPEWASWTKSGEAIFMIMLGGINSFFGPLVGALTMRVIDDVALQYTTHIELTKGIIILFVVLVLKRGILDFIIEQFGNRAKRRVNRRQSEETDAAP